VLCPRLDPKDLELERAVVLEEIASVEDTPDDLIFDLHGSHFWNGHPYGQMILGTRETVSALKIDDLYRLHTDRYTGNNIIVACAGDIEHEVVADCVAKLFGNAPAGKICSDIDVPLGNLTGQEFVVRNTAQAHLVFGNQTPPHGSDM
jgi:predicted Zn-dependent peptidase